MKKRLVISFAFLSILSLTGFQQKAMEEYCNGRFSFCISYPVGFKGEGEAGNGDGQRFLSKDKQAEIATWGMNVLEEINDNVKDEFESASEKITVTYKVIKPTSFIFSGLNQKGEIVYRKSVMKKIADEGSEEEDTMVWQTLMITYPKSQQNLYGSYCGVIAKSLQ
jgi:hypothetical protein